MNNALKLLALGALACLAANARADIVTLTGNSSASPAYNRLLEDLSAVSGVGTAVPYDTYTFSVDTAGDYTFLSTAKFDNFLFLYSPAINPAQPLINAKRGDDDMLPGFTTSGFQFTLAANVDYVVVTTGFGNTDFGAFSNTIGGPGTITAAAPQPPPVPIAGLLTYTGDTSDDPTFNRALEDLSALSAVGTNVRYDRFGFRVDTSGSYTFTSTAEFDNFSFLYSPTLDSLHPLVNGLEGDDDLLGFTTSGFAFDLVADVDYEFVTTGFANEDFGAFSNTIAGPGSITAIDSPTANVAAPQSLALVLLGLAALGFARRSKQAA